MRGAMRLEKGFRTAIQQVAPPRGCQSKFDSGVAVGDSLADSHKSGQNEERWCQTASEKCKMMRPKDLVLRSLLHTAALCRRY